MREMEEEIQTFIKVWASAIISVSYCYFVSQKIKAGVFRLISVLPVCALCFFVLPLSFSSVYLSFITSASFTFLISLKLILFAFDNLFQIPPNLIQFLCLICLPIHPQRNPKSQDNFPKWVFPVKVVLLGVVLHVYKHIENLRSFLLPDLYPLLLLSLYPLHVYLLVEVPLTILKPLLTVTLGFDIEPFFNEPYLATSLQDFWGRRWNLPVTAILKSSVFMPVRRVCSHFMNLELATIFGVLASFLVSGVLHEVIYFYVTHESPTREVTWFFVLHGVCTVVEVLVKRKTFVGRWVVRPIVSRVLTVGFVVLSGAWLFFPQLKRSGTLERIAGETLLLIDSIHEFLIFVSRWLKWW